MKDLTKGNIYKTFILFAIPLILSAIMSQAFNIVNTVMAGKYLGDIGLAATGSTSGFFTFYGSVFWGWGMGLSIQVAKLFGAKDYKALKNIIYNNAILVFILLIVAGICMTVFKNPILGALKVDKAVWDDASSYFVLTTIGYFTLAFNTWGVYLCNSLGITSFPFIVSLISSVLSTVAKFFVLTKLNAGVAGLAAVSLVNAAIVDIFYIIKLGKCFKEMNVHKEKIHLDTASLKETAGYAIPVTFQQMSMSAVSIIITPLVNGIGSSASAAYSVVSNMFNLNAQIYQNSAKTVSNYSAQCVGAREFYKLKKGIQVGFIQGLVFLTPVLLISVIFSEKICSMYFPDGYAGESLNYSIIFTKYYLPFIVFNMINNLFHAFYRGAMAMKSLVSATLIGSITRIIPTILLVPRMGMQGVYVGWVISWILEAVFTVTLYFTGIWKKEKINMLMADENPEFD